MRRVLLAVLAASLLGAASAEAASSYCSPSGDSCWSAKRRDGVVRLRLDTFSLRGVLGVCVTAPDGSRTCRAFRLRERRGLFTVDVQWSRHFPRRGPGRYLVDFAADGTRPLSPRVGFTLKG